jgi:hypothetical protein
LRWQPHVPHEAKYAKLKNRIRAAGYTPNEETQMPAEKKPDHQYTEAGRRVKAALISYLMGRAGVDRTLKEVPENPGEGWGISRKAPS